MKNILIVDDESPIRKLLTTFLTEAGYTCIQAEDVEHARQVLASQPIDLILSDINMPRESGIDLVRFVQRHFPDVAIVIVSVIDNPNAAKEAFELGVYGYIVKPFTRNIVLIGVENALRRNQLELQSRAYQQDLEVKLQQQLSTMQEQYVFLQNLINAIPSAVFHLSREGVFLGCNKVFENFVGKSGEELKGKNVVDLFPKDLAAIYRIEDSQLQRDEHQHYELLVTDAAGLEKNLLINKAIYVDEAGRVDNIVGVMMDTTVQKKMEQALRTSEEKFRQIVENIDIGVALLNPEMEILQMNPQMHKWFPLVEPGVGHVCYESFQKPTKDVPCENCPAIKTFAEGKSFESTIKVEGGHRIRYFKDHSTPIHDANGKVTAAVLLVEDVTEKLELERELRQAQKLEAIGQLAAGIAHEINTPIQYVGDNTGFLKESFEDLATVFSAYNDLLQAGKDNSITDTMLSKVDECILKADLSYLTEEIPRAIEQSLEGVQRVTEIVRAMRDFSHPGSEEKILVDLNHAIRNTITVARNEWKYVAEMELDLEPELPEVLCLPGEINQVLLNIIVNAAHAIAASSEGSQGDKGTISIASHTRSDSVAIHISDTGSGVPKEIQHRIFDPFFTTKGVGHGTGQGLAIAHNVIKDKHGGNLRFETQPGEGTTFIIELPLRPTGEQT